MTFRRFQRKKIVPLSGPTGDTPESLLARIEAARIGKVLLVESYRPIFDKLEHFETEEQECLTTLKRLLYTTKGPPPGANMISRAKARPAEGKFCNVEVTYKREADYYDPAALPPDVLITPGVVAKVDAKRIEALRDPRCEHARRKGEWMTPTVSITRKDREANPPSDFEADPDKFACPDGQYCKDISCIEENKRRGSGRNYK